MIEGKPAANPLPLLNEKLRLFMLAMVLANTGTQMYLVLLPLYLVELNADIAQVGLFFTLSRILPLILQVLGGWMSDSLGRLRSVALGSLAGVLAFLGFILAPTWQWVLLAEGVMAVTRSLVAPSFPAFIAEQSSEEMRARVYGITQTIYGVVTVIGPALGGWLADLYSFKVMLVCAGSIYALAAIIRVGMVRVAARGSEARPQRLSLGGLRSSLGAILGMVLAGGVFTWVLITDRFCDVSLSLSSSLEPLYLQEIGRLSGSQIGLLFSIFGVFTMVANVPAGWLADRKGERTAIALGLAFIAAGITVFLRATAFWGFAASWVLFGLGMGAMEPTYQSLVSKVVPGHLRGTAFGLLWGSLSVFSLPAPAVGAQLWERVSPRLPFRLASGMILALIVPVWLKLKLPDKKGVCKEMQSEAR
jgi:MFS family permease